MNDIKISNMAIFNITGKKSLNKKNYYYKILFGENHEDRCSNF